MSSVQSTQLDKIFFALADPTRRGIIRQLAKGEATVGQLSSPFGLAPATISKHLQVLERAGLIRRRRDGRHLRNRLNPVPFRAGMDWLAEMQGVWEEQLDVLESLLQSERRRPRK
jgi:DNA-binding transcriptional ArsR family regulator